MAQFVDTSSQDGLELDGARQVSRRLKEREDSDTAALRQAGKTPVLKVRSQILFHQHSHTS